MVPASLPQRRGSAGQGGREAGEPDSFPVHDNGIAPAGSRHAGTQLRRWQGAHRGGPVLQSGALLQVRGVPFFDSRRGLTGAILQMCSVTEVTVSLQLFADG